MLRLTAVKICFRIHVGCGAALRFDFISFFIILGEFLLKKFSFFIMDLSLEI